MALINYENKASLTVDPTIAEKNKVTDENMNEIKSVVNENSIKVSPIEPTGTEKEKVWIKYSKNMLDLSTYKPSINGLTTTFSNGILTVNGTPTKDYTEIWSIPTAQFTSMLEDGKTYVMKSTNADTKLYGVITITPISSGSATYINTRSGAVSFTVDKSKYRYYIDIQTSSISSTGSISNFKIGLQLEPGTSASEYEPFVSPSINVNNNGSYKPIAYKNVYSTNEVVIGEFMGKPLYRKVIEFKPTTAMSSIPHNISNLEKITNYYGTVFTTGSKKMFPTIYTSNMATTGTGIYDYNTTILEVNCGTNILSTITSIECTLEYTKTTD